MAVSDEIVKVTPISAAFKEKLVAAQDAELEKQRIIELDANTETTQWGLKVDNFDLGIIIAVVVTLVGTFLVALICFCVRESDIRQEAARNEKASEVKFKKEAEDILRHQNTISYKDSKPQGF